MTDVKTNSSSIIMPPYLNSCIKHWNVPDHSCTACHLDLAAGDICLPFAPRAVSQLKLVNEFVNNDWAKPNILTTLIYVLAAAACGSELQTVRF